MPSSQWTAADLPDQTGRTFLITGGNSGVGFEAARILAGAGGDVILAVRDTAKGERAAAEIPGGAEVRGSTWPVLTRCGSSPGTPASRSMS